MSLLPIAVIQNIEKGRYINLLLPSALPPTFPLERSPSLGSSHEKIQHQIFIFLPYHPKSILKPDIRNCHIPVWINMTVLIFLIIPFYDSQVFPSIGATRTFVWDGPRYWIRPDTSLDKITFFRESFGRFGLRLLDLAPYVVLGPCL